MLVWPCRCILEPGISVWLYELWHQGWDRARGVCSACQAWYPHKAFFDWSGSMPSLDLMTGACWFHVCAWLDDFLQTPDCCPVVQVAMT